MCMGFPGTNAQELVRQPVTTWTNVRDIWREKIDHGLLSFCSSLHIWHDFVRLLVARIKEKNIYLKD